MLFAAMTFSGYLHGGSSARWTLCTAEAEVLRGGHFTRRKFCARRTFCTAGALRGYFLHGATTLRSDLQLDNSFGDLTTLRAVSMKSTKVQNPRRILHILRSMPMRVHCACAGSVGNCTHAHYL